MANSHNPLIELTFLLIFTNVVPFLQGLYCTINIHNSQSGHQYLPLVRWHLKHLKLVQKLYFFFYTVYFTKEFEFYYFESLLFRVTG